MIADQLVHVGGNEIIPDLVGVLEHEPAPGPVDREDTDLLPRGSYQRATSSVGSSEEALEGDHELLHGRGR